MNRERFEEFEKSVYALADKLPQWSSDDYTRRVYSAVSSLYEELGEVCGIVSKKRIRKEYWKANPKNLADFEEIRQKFIDELSDCLWVMVCSRYSLAIDKDNYLKLNDNIDIYNLLTNIPNDKIKVKSLEEILFSIIDRIHNLVFLTKCDYRLQYGLFELIFSDFGYVLNIFNKEYNITLDDLINHNMNKLDNRYDKDGKRLDGK